MKSLLLFYPQFSEEGAWGEIDSGGGPSTITIKTSPVRPQPAKRTISLTQPTHDDSEA